MWVLLPYWLPGHAAQTAFNPWVLKTSVEPASKHTEKLSSNGNYECILAEMEPAQMMSFMNMQAKGVEGIVACGSLPLL